MRTVWLTLALAGCISVGWGQTNTLTLDDVMDSAQQWAEENLDLEMLRQLSAADQQKVQQLLKDLQSRFQRQYVVDLAPLRDAGLGYVSFSIDAGDAAAHDDFRRFPGAFASARNGIKAAKKAGLDVAILTTITNHNYRDLPRIIKRASDLGARYFIPFFLVPTGKGRDLRHLQLSPSGSLTLRTAVRPSRESSPVVGTLSFLLASSLSM